MQCIREHGLGNRLVASQAIACFGKRVSGFEQQCDLRSAEFCAAVAHSGQFILEGMTQFFHERQACGARGALERVHHAKHGAQALRIVGRTLECEKVVVQLLDLLVQLVDEDDEQTSGQRIIGHRSPAPRADHADELRTQLVQVLRGSLRLMRRREVLLRSVMNIRDGLSNLIHAQRLLAR